MSRETPSDGAAVRFPPPFVPLIALAVGEVVHRCIWPLAIPIPGLARATFSLLLLAAGAALLLGAAGSFRKTGQDPKPWLPSPEIIRDGIYRYTRNPMYVSMGLLQAGLGIALADGWVILLVPATWFTIYLIAVRHEEAYLEDKFGDTYRDYKREVRRWL